MPFPLLPLIGLGGSLFGGLLGGRKKKSQPGVLGQMAQKNLGTSSDYFNKILSDPAEATATTTSDLGRQFQQGMDYNARHLTRNTGAVANAEAPYRLASAAKGQQILARMGAAKNLGELGGTAGRLDLGQQGLDIERTQQDRNFWSDIGSSIGGFLTQPGGLGKDSILGKIFSKPAPGSNAGGSATQTSLPSQKISGTGADIWPLPMGGS